MINEFVHSVTRAVSSDVRGQYFTGILSYLYYFIVLGLKLSPITLILLVFGGVFYKKLVKQPYFKYFILTIGYFAYLLVLLTIADKKIDRYSVILFLGLLLAISVLVSKASKTLKVAVFGGTSQALKYGFYENSGEYYSDAAFYVNQQGRGLKVLVPDNYESFIYYSWNKYQKYPGAETDYVVSSVDFDRKLPRSEICPKLVKTFGPRGTNVVFVYKCEDGFPIIR